MTLSVKLGEIPTLKLLPHIALSGSCTAVTHAALTFRVLSWPSSCIVPGQANGCPQGGVALFIEEAQVFQLCGTGRWRQDEERKKGACKLFDTVLTQQY